MAQLGWGDLCVEQGQGVVCSTLGARTSCFASGTHPDIRPWNRSVPEQPCHEPKEIISCRGTNMGSL